MNTILWVLGDILESKESNHNHTHPYPITNGKFALDASLNYTL